MTLDELKHLLDIDFDASAKTIEYIDDLLRDVADREPTVHQLAAFGTYLHNVYTGVAPSPPLPLLLPPRSAEHLVEFRGFRHVFNKRYALHLDWAKMRPLINSARATFEAFRAGVDDAIQDAENKPGA